MHRNWITVLLILVLLLPSALIAQTSMKLVVDATELPRKLIHSQIHLATSGTEMTLHFPKWIPGIHFSGGPVHNMGGFEVFDDKGRKVAWQRDWTDHYGFVIRPDETAKSLRIDLTYICNQPSTNSVGVDTYGAKNLGAINWNTLFVYPEGTPTRDIEVEVELVLPEGWQHGSALPLHGRRNDTLVFKSASLEDLVDMPLICGRYFRTIELAKTDLATYYFHLAADSEADLPEAGDSTVLPLTRMVLEAEAMFGGVHFDEYHLLLLLTDEFRTIGLEHRNNSLNGVKASEFRKPDWAKKRTPYLLPHEFAHAWCGKYRRPVGMNTDDFQADKNTNLLWVYEGLDQYLGYVLAARCGYMDSSLFVETVAGRIGSQKIRSGRGWRPLQDTEVSAGMLRGGSKSWSLIRRSQDYYDEGALHWMEFDAMIRNGSNGKKSLDDFCAIFFNKADKQAHAISFDREEVVATLNQVHPAPWDSLIEVRVYQPADELALDVVEKIGCKLEFTDKKPAWIADREGFYKFVDHRQSLGFSLSSKDDIRDITPNSPSDNAGITPRSKIIGVNGKKFTKERLDDAIRATIDGNDVRLLLMNGENYEEKTLKYRGGLRYLQLLTLDGKRNLLHYIARPRITGQN